MLLQTPSRMVWETPDPSPCFLPLDALDIFGVSISAPTNDVVIVPRDNGFPVPDVALNGPQKHKCNIVGLSSFIRAFLFLFSIGLQDHQHSPNVTFHNLGLWGNDVNKGQSRTWKLRKLSSIRSQLGHSQVSIRNRQYAYIREYNNNRNFVVWLCNTAVKWH